MVSLPSLRISHTSFPEPLLLVGSATCSASASVSHIQPENDVCSQVSAECKYDALACTFARRLGFTYSQDSRIEFSRGDRWFEGPFRRNGVGGYAMVDRTLGDSVSILSYWALNILSWIEIFLRKDKFLAL